MLGGVRIPSPWGVNPISHHAGSGNLSRVQCARVHDLSIRDVIPWEQRGGIPRILSPRTHGEGGVVG